ncbi:GNAT superfamily N-acetyltransferase [Deinococcus sp. HSC-46F16]|uniref:GNAT family N-acetyltransferase n=1 Tax=Deinococcus sp. HSC-46F16 TaxID=2910968 RepID=UPI00209F6F63|nr:GNAT family N-acetyltransferase [Deinococcus sp. HSC-46F16]MCP2015696.1 GNAT superfamily N-acetyltransferase [Deinococcus sp. HSC-46F16]
MNTYTIETPTLDTLADFFALHPDPQDVAKRLPILRQNVAAGRVRLENLLILRSERGIEGTALISAAPQVPVFPRFRPDVMPEGVTALALALRDRAEPERKLLLQDNLAPLRAAPVEGAGWVLDEEHVMYETDLRARTFVPDPQARSVTPDDPAVRVLLGALGRAGFELREGWHLVVLPDTSGQPVALGAFGPSGRPEWASLDQIGVHPSARGQGLGTRLHAHLLARAAEQFTMHAGGTGADNHAMRRILASNGSRHVATQMYFRPA